MVFCEMFTRSQRSGLCPPCLEPFRQDVRGSYKLFIYGNENFQFPEEMTVNPKKYSQHLTLQILSCYPENQHIEHIKKTHRTHKNDRRKQASSAL